MKTVLITGGNSGIGKATAERLAAAGHQVFIAARDMRKSEQAVSDIRHRHPRAEIEALPLDLADLDNVRHFVADFRERVPVLDVLILNAGLFPTHKQLTRQGFEMQFGVNHLGHFLLTRLLLDTVVAAPAGRVVVVSSIMHWLGRIDFDSFSGSKPYHAVRAYGQSKLCNILFTQELARRLAGTRVTVNAAHPGGVDTGIARDLPLLLRKLYSLTTVSAEKGARTPVYLASSDEIAGVTGRFFSNGKPRRTSPLARADTAARLWEVSETLCKS